MKKNTGIPEEETEEQTELLPPEEGGASSPPAIVPHGLSAAEKLLLALKQMEVTQLNVIQKSSQISGDPGALVADKKYELVAAETPMDVVVLTSVQRWKEDVPYESNDKARFVDTPAEAARLAQESPFEVVEFADVYLLIPAPEGNEDEEAYPYPIAGRNWALGRMHCAKNAYRCTHKRIFTFTRFNPDALLHERFWSFRTELQESGKYKFFVPSLTQTKNETPQEFRDALPKIFGIE